LSVIILAWAATKVWGGAESGVIKAFYTDSTASIATVSLQYLDVFMFGALGAFFPYPSA
jgi:hypothetical protein